MALFNLARMTTSTTGTGIITLGTAVSGFLTFSGAGVADGQTISYGISDGANSEVGTGVYTASGTTLTRTVTKSTNADAAISLTGAAQVYITARAEDLAGSKAGFHATHDADQTIANETFVKVNFAAAVYNDGTLYNTSLSRWTPPAGKFQIAAAVGFLGVHNLYLGTPIVIGIFKNGVQYKYSYGAVVGVYAGANIAIVDTCNGTDYFEVWIFVYTSTTGTLSNAPAWTYFMGSQL
jgi:hypothetical protein